MTTLDEKNQAFGYDTSKKQTFLGAIVVEGEFDDFNEPAWFEFFLMGENGIDICHFGCNGTWRSGSFQGEEVNLPAPFAKAFLELLEKHKRGEKPPERPRIKELPYGYWW